MGALGLDKVKILAATACARDPDDPMRWQGTSTAAVYTLCLDTGEMTLDATAPCTCNSMWAMGMGRRDLWVTDCGVTPGDAGIRRYEVVPYDTPDTGAKVDAPANGGTSAATPAPARAVVRPAAGDQACSFIPTGLGPCHVSADPDGGVYVSEYESGRVSYHSLRRGDAGGSTALRTVVTGEVLGEKTARQDAPHPHSALPLTYTVGGGSVGEDTRCGPQRSQGVVVCDLGTDLVVLYSGGLLEKVAECQLLKGTGPRHSAVYTTPAATTYCCVVGELNNTLTVLSLPDLHVVAVRSTIPDGWSAAKPFSFYTEPSHAAGIAVSEATRTVFVTNRGHDSIAAFRIGDDGVLSLPSFTTCEGRLPWCVALAPRPKGPPLVMVTHQFDASLTGGGGVAVYEQPGDGGHNDNAATPPRTLRLLSSAPLQQALFVSVL